MEGAAAPRPPLLLSLPPELLALVLTKVQGGKNALRSACRGLRLAVDASTETLTWARPTTSIGRSLRAAPQVDPVFLRFQLPYGLAACLPRHRTLSPSKCAL